MTALTWAYNDLQADTVFASVNNRTQDQKYSAPNGPSIKCAMHASWSNRNVRNMSRCHLLQQPLSAEDNWHTRKGKPATSREAFLVSGSGCMKQLCHRMAWAQRIGTVGVFVKHMQCTAVVCSASYLLHPFSSSTVQSTGSIIEFVSTFICYQCLWKPYRQLLELRYLISLGGKWWK